ncbi:MAG: hypothetical protein M2R45_00924 [Verrucomicrobia subdivision 3 bacterium]|nr:hypothetical protein [Limisphaerales bacterium]MCS1414593.1 hypothetical protein [Limisphaerales bacterium]
MNDGNGSKDSSEKESVWRRLYGWVLSWADHPAGTWALFFIAMLESFAFPIPPDVLLIALCVGGVAKSYKFALVCTAGSLIGGVIGYGIGYWGFELIGQPIVKFYHGDEVMEKIKYWYGEHGFWGNLTAAVTPIPYKVFTIASGAFKFPVSEFLLASIIGRSLRFFAVATALYFFGLQIRCTIDKYFNLCAWLFVVMLIAGFLALKYLR